VVAEPDGVDRLVRGLRVCAVQRREVPDVVDDTQVVVDRGVLGDVTDPVAQFRGSGRSAQHGDRPAGDDLGTDDRAHQRGLAAAGRAEDAGDRAARDSDRHVVQGAPVAAHNPQVPDFDHGSAD
jgi:hypothetical protein